MINIIKMTRIADHMPPENEYVLIRVILDGYEEHFREAMYEDGGRGVICWFIPGVHCDVPRTVTHWIPLPGWD